MKCQSAILAKSGARWPLAVIVMLLGLQTPLVPAQAGPEERVGLPIDWSSHHIIFTNGASPEVAAKQVHDPRSWISWAQRSAWMLPRFTWEPLPPAFPRSRHMRVDWAMPLGASAGMPLAESPAKYSFNVNSTPSCSNDFVVYTIAANPSSTQANLVAFNNLYTGTSSSSCPIANQSPVTTDLTQPTYMWAYALGTEGSALSPTISLSGTKVSFIETGTANTVTSPAYFDVVTPVSGQGSSATSPCLITSAGSSSCGGTTLVRLNYTDSGITGCGSGTTNSNSSAYIDYGSDSAYIGADNGILYRISGVFKGTPAVQYCIQVGSATAKLTSPVYDEVTGEVFVSDGFTVYAYSVGNSGFTKLNSVALASTSAANGDPIILSPIVDTTNGFVYVFSSADSSNTYSIVAQFKIQTNGSLGTPATADIGPAGGNDTTYIFDGDFDNAYVTSGPTNGAGTLYACGTQTGAATKPALYAMSFQSGTGAMNSTPVLSDNANITTAADPASICSPLMEFFNGTTDQLFVGTGSITGTGGANLVTAWNVTSRITSSAATPAYTATNEWGGTSAFSVDNVSTEAQASSIYFGTLQPAASGTAPSCPKGQYCAIKLTQTGLR